MTDIIYDDPPRRPKWILPVVCVGVLVVAACVVAAVAVNASGARPGATGEAAATGGATHGGGLSESAAHQVVKDFILDNANDAKSVEFQRWGPDDLSGELCRMFPEMNLADQAVRVRFREKNDKGAMVLQDLITYLKSGKVVVAVPNGMGDNWIAIKKSQAPKPRT